MIQEHILRWRSTGGYGAAGIDCLVALLQESVTIGVVGVGFALGSVIVGIYRLVALLQGPDTRGGAVAGPDTWWWRCGRFRHPVVALW